MVVQEEFLVGSAVAMRTRWTDKGKRAERVFWQYPSQFREDAEVGLAGRLTRSCACEGLSDSRRAAVRRCGVLVTIGDGCGLAGQEFAGGRQGRIRVGVDYSAIRCDGKAKRAARATSGRIVIRMPRSDCFCHKRK